MVGLDWWPPPDATTATVPTVPSDPSSEVLTSPVERVTELCDPALGRCGGMKLLSMFSGTPTSPRATNSMVHGSVAADAPSQNLQLSRTYNLLQRRQTTSYNSGTKHVDSIR